MTCMPSMASMQKVTIVIGGKWLVMPGGEVLQMHPGGHAAGVGAFHARLADAQGCGLHIAPGLGWLIGVQAGFAKRLTVVDKHRR